MNQFTNLPEHSIIRPNPEECHENGLSSDLYNIIRTTVQAIRLAKVFNAIDLKDVPEERQEEVRASVKKYMDGVRENLADLCTISEYYEAHIDNHNRIASDDDKVEKSELLAALIGLLNPDRMAIFDTNIKEMKKIGCAETIDIESLRDLCDQQYRLVYGRPPSSALT